MNIVGENIWISKSNIFFKKLSYVFKYYNSIIIECMIKKKYFHINSF